MKATVMLFVVCIALVIAKESLGGADEAVKRVLKNAAYTIDDEVYRDGEYSYSWKLCDHDTNRYERIMRELAESDLANSASTRKRLCKCMLRRMGEVGTTNSLPFLYSCATNPVVGDVAMLSAVKIGGIDNAAIDSLAEYLALTNVTILTRVGCCEKIVKGHGVSITNILLRSKLADCLTGFAPGVDAWTDPIDESINLIDPTYRHSRRRLGVLRSQSEFDLNDYDRNYVTNAISELVAYPESALGE